MSAEQVVRDLGAQRGWTGAQIEDFVAIVNEAGVQMAPAPAPPKPWVAPYEGAPRPGERGVRVYVILEGGGCAKIGISDAPYARMDALQTGNSRLLEVAYYTREYARDFALRIERSAHAQLSEYAVHREWFDCGPSTAIGAIEDQGGVEADQEP